MTITEAILMAYVDGELEPGARAQVEAAMAADPDIARRIARHRAFRDRLRASFDEVMEEPVPDRLLATARAASVPGDAGKVAPIRRRTTARWAWPQWGSIAASLIVGAVAGQQFLRPSPTGPITDQKGQLLASGVLGRALSQQLASQRQRLAPVQVGISFRSKSGEYCRTFVLRGPGDLAGLACRTDAQWQVQVLAKQSPLPGSNGQYRPAGSALPAPVLTAVDERIAGEPLDAPAEAAARDRNWQR